MLGLDNGGKTTILYKLKMGEVVQTTPTIGALEAVFFFHWGSNSLLQVSMWKLYRGKILRSLCGTWVVRIRFVPYVDLLPGNWMCLNYPSFMFSSSMFINCCECRFEGYGDTIS